MEHTADNDIFTGGADQLFHNKVPTFAEFQDFTQQFIRHPIKSSAFTISVTRLVKQWAKIDFASEAKFRKDNIRELPLRRKLQRRRRWLITLPYIQRGQKTTKLGKRNEPIIPPPSSSSGSECGSIQESDEHEVNKHGKRRKGVQIHKRMSTQFITALNCPNYGLLMLSHN